MYCLCEAPNSNPSAVTLVLMYLPFLLSNVYILTLDCVGKVSLICQFLTRHARVNGHLNYINLQYGRHCRHCPYPYETTISFSLSAQHFQMPEKSYCSSHQKLLTLYVTLQPLPRTCTLLRIALGYQEYIAQQIGIE